MISEGNLHGVASKEGCSGASKPIVSNKPFREVIRDSSTSASVTKEKEEGPYYQPAQDQAQAVRVTMCRQGNSGIQLE